MPMKTVASMCGMRSAMPRTQCMLHGLHGLQEDLRLARQGDAQEALPLLWPMPEEILARQHIDVVTQQVRLQCIGRYARIVDAKPGHAGFDHGLAEAEHAAI